MVCLPGMFLHTRMSVNHNALLHASSTCPHLPELHADGAVQLHQTCLQVHRLALGVVQVDGRALVVVPLDLTQVHA